MNRKIPAVASPSDLDAAMAVSREARARLAAAVLDHLPPAPEDIAVIEAVLEALLGAPSTDGRTLLDIGQGRATAFDLSFEVQSLEEDLIFLTRGETALCDLFTARERDFDAATERGRKLLRDRRWHCLLADRDGTLLDYCGRYASSVQPAWNAVYLARFCRTRCERAVLLTSGPLDNGGVVSVTTLPPGTMDLAASKGREWLARDGTRGAMPLPEKGAVLLKELGNRLAALLDRPEYAIFGRIGSGLQRKRGELTVARQDTFASVDPADSTAFLDRVRALATELDPAGETICVEDTGLDIEIGLAALGRAFDKGQALGVLEPALGLDFSRGPLLVLGDSASDLPMLRAAMDRASEVRAMFVTRTEALAREVHALCPDALCVGAPVTLVSILNDLSRLERRS